MDLNIIAGLLIPFAGTTLGAMMVLFMKNEINNNLQRILTGFAAGVMVSASFWSLLIPAVDQATETGGKLGVLHAVAGFGLGILFLLLIDTLTPHMHLDETVEGPKSGLKKTTMLVLKILWMSLFRHIPIVFMVGHYPFLIPSRGLQ